MSKQNQIKDFPQNSRKVKRVVIMNMGNSIALDLYRFLTLFWTGSGRTLYWTGGGQKAPRVNSAI